MNGTSKSKRPVVAFGPETPGWGSWDWVGRDIAHAMEAFFPTVTYGWGEGPPECDVLVVVKHALPEAFVEEVSRRAAVIYAPTDHYGSQEAITADRGMLRRCARIVVHCPRLRPYFEPVAPVALLDHHVKFVTTRPQEYRKRGPVLWVGVRSNLPYLADWVNRHPLPEELCVLTNLPDGFEGLDPADWGFADPRNVRIENWSPARHLQRLDEARAALDIKGQDFCQRHKPATKAVDFLATALPLAMNPGTSSGEYLATLGYDVAAPQDTDRWFSRDYWEETRALGAALRSLCSLEQVGRRWRRLINQVWTQRRDLSRTRDLPTHADERPLLYEGSAT